MAKPLTANDVKNKAYALREYWSPRAQQFTDWYKLLRLEDELATENMESFTSNDPRTLYNLALFLLTPKVIPFNIPIDGANETIQAAIATTESFIANTWKNLQKDMRRKAKQGWLRYHTALELATGWYSVRHIATDNGLFADIWNPAEVFPDFDPDIGLACVAHIYTTSVSAVRKTIANNNGFPGWQNLTFTQQSDIEVIDYWYYDEGGIPTNCVVMGRNFARIPTPFPHMDEIPISCSPVAGLPDVGSIDLDPIKWKKNFGESIVATNAGLYRSYNRQMSFMMQIMRDSAQPRLQVRSKGAREVVTQANWNKRGAIYNLDTDEDISFLAGPGLPPELSLNTQVTEREIERGGLPFALYTGEGMNSGYQQNLTSASAEEILRDYREASSFLVTDICNSWMKQIRKGNLHPMGFVIPPTLPEFAEFEVDIKITIPGDLISRAATARQLDPTFSLSHTTTMDMVFPEIRDPNRELILGRRDVAMANPINATLDLMGAWEDQANALEAEGNYSLANRYRNAIKMAEAQMGQGPITGLPQGYKGFINDQNNPGASGQGNAGQP